MRIKVDFFLVEETLLEWTNEPLWNTGVQKLTCALNLQSRNLRVLITPTGEVFEHTNSSEKEVPRLSLVRYRNFDGGA